MKILIVEDERIIAADLADSLEEMGHEICGSTGFGEVALKLAASEKPDMIIMDIHLEGKMDGIETATEVKEKHKIPVIYLSAFSDEEIVAKAGGTEPFGYLVKPFQPAELNTTIQVAASRARLEKELRQVNAELEKSLEEVKQLSGLLPICSNCKKIRDGEDYWQQVEEYFAKHSDAEFTHSICPDCVEKLYPELGNLFSK